MLILGIRHPALPLGMIWLAIPSFLVYVLAWMAGIVGLILPKEGVVRYLPGKTSLTMNSARMALYLPRSVWIVLSSGSYVLMDIRVASENFRLYVRLI